MRQTLSQIAEAISQANRTDEIASHLADWRKTASAAISSSSRHLDTRRRHGYVRRCHGDLHLANICLFEGRPTPFDAIEFSEEVGTVDILYDLAFLIMDLWGRGLRAQANRVMNRWLAERRNADDLDGLALLPLFLSMRAAIRAKVAAPRAAHLKGDKRAAARTLCTADG